uniref:Beta-galactoside-specific lectin 1 B chain n=1 Tax=Viscum album TaxID=3972 RepID=UPI00045EDEA9|nr:Chain B, Beta-galactoside-specific lectin 1 B chain [Viscum album]
DDVTCSASEPTVRIVGRNGMTVDVRDDDFHDGNQIQLWPSKSNNDPNQLWTIKKDGTIRSNGSCLTTYGYTAGVYVMIFDCNTAVREATIWEIWGNGTIINPRSNLVLAASSGIKGTTLTVQTLDYTLGQGWLAGNDTAPREVTIYGFRDLCMESNGGSVWVETCVASQQNQRWALYGDGSIRPKQNQSQCLTCGRDSVSTVINIVSCSAGSSGQRWVFTNAGAILNLKNGLAMDVAQANPSLQRIIIYPATGNPNQMWLPVP